MNAINFCCFVGLLVALYATNPVASSRIKDLERRLQQIEGGLRRSHNSLFCGVGISSGKIPNHAMVASSSWDSQHAAHFARLDNMGFWHAARHMTRGWVQVDLGKPTTIVGVITQGRTRPHEQWITKYKIQYGNAYGGSYTVKRYSRHDKIFRGNFDTNSKVTNIFPHSITARFFRLVIVAYHGAPVLRLEYLVC